MDNIDIGAATERGVVVVHSPGGNTIATAEHTVGMLLALSRNIPQATASMKRGAWERKSYTGVELNGKVLGIVGVGRVGQHVARLAGALGMTVVGHDPLLSEEMAARFRVRLTSLEEIYETADYITLHTPLNEATRHLISASSLATCKPGVRVLNCARGGAGRRGGASERDRIRQGGRSGARRVREGTPAQGPSAPSSARGDLHAASGRLDHGGAGPRGPPDRTRMYWKY